MALPLSPSRPLFPPSSPAFAARGHPINPAHPSPRSSRESSASSSPTQLRMPLSPGDRASSRDDDRRHVCDVCGKAFNRPSSLAIHKNTHTGDKRT